MSRKSVELSSFRLTSPAGEVLPLTGIRILAALWVVVFHFRGNLWTEYPGVRAWLEPVLENGDLGVDLFFALSGFVLALNYIDRIGDRVTRADTAKFLWARLARVWPVYFVTLNIAALWHGFLIVRGFDPVEVKEFSVLSYLRQVFMVVMWTEPDNERVTWNGPAWSISAEWFVYLLFPLLAMLLLRFSWVLRVRHLVVLATAAVFPSILITIVSGSAYQEYSWVLRLLGAFTAGGIACVAARRIARTKRNDTIATWASAVLGLGILGVLYACHATDNERLYGLSVFLFAPFLIAISVSGRGLLRLLSTRPFVLGGHISYSVYLVHMLLIEPIWWAQNTWPETFAPHTVLIRALFLSVPVVVCLVAYCMWRWVEEPARLVMRGMTKRPMRTPAAVEDTDHTGRNHSSRAAAPDLTAGRPLTPTP